LTLAARDNPKRAMLKNRLIPRFHPADPVSFIIIYVAFLEPMALS
jgi:hypothetical protein